MERIVECVPNFSEGRDMTVIGRIAEAISGVSGIRILDIDPGAAANRTVITFTGSPEAVAEAAFRGVEKAAELIDMRLHHGNHPRMGATDVLPFVPVSGISLDECILLARTVAGRIFTESGIPCYCYEAAAFRPERRRLEICRHGEYEALPARIADPEQRPDFSPDTFTEMAARAGATIVGARNFLIAVNFDLEKGCPESLASEIAKDVRESGRTVTGPDGSRQRIPGTLKGCKAIGWYIEEYGIAQVSMNITDIAATPRKLPERKSSDWSRVSACWMRGDTSLPWNRAPESLAAILLTKSGILTKTESWRKPSKPCTSTTSGLST